MVRIRLKTLRFLNANHLSRLRPPQVGIRLRIHIGVRASQTQRRAPLDAARDGDILAVHVEQRWQIVIFHCVSVGCCRDGFVSSSWVVQVGRFLRSLLSAEHHSRWQLWPYAQRDISAGNARDLSGRIGGCKLVKAIVVGQTETRWLDCDSPFPSRAIKFLRPQGIPDLLSITCCFAPMTAQQP
jgi:hypothetical protein